MRQVVIGEKEILMSDLSVPLPGETLPSASGELLLLLLHPGRLGENTYYYVCTYNTVGYTYANQVQGTTVNS